MAWQISALLLEWAEKRAAGAATTGKNFHTSRFRGRRKHDLGELLFRASPWTRAETAVRCAGILKREHDERREEGSKDRPRAIVVSVLEEKEEEEEVTVLPIAHNAPQRVEDAIEIPPSIKQRLGLDSERSWSVITEANEFV